MIENIIRFLGDIRLYKGGIVLFGESSYRVKGEEAREIDGLVKPGDVLLRRYEHYLGSLLIPGYWSHTGIYVGNHEVVHVLHDGVVKEDLLNFLRCDDVKVLRTSNSTLTISAVEKALELYDKHIKYDFEFDFEDNTKMSCSEFIDYCYGHPRYSNTMISGKIVPDDLENTIFTEVVWSRD